MDDCSRGSPFGKARMILLEPRKVMDSRVDPGWVIVAILRLLLIKAYMMLIEKSNKSRENCL